MHFDLFMCICLSVHSITHRARNKSLSMTSEENCISLIPKWRVQIHKPKSQWIHKQSLKEDSNSANKCAVPRRSLVVRPMLREHKSYKSLHFAMPLPNRINTCENKLVYDIDGTPMRSTSSRPSDSCAVFLLCAVLFVLASVVGVCGCPLQVGVWIKMKLRAHGVSDCEMVADKRSRDSETKIWMELIKWLAGKVVVRLLIYE